MIEDGGDGGAKQEADGDDDNDEDGGDDDDEQERWRQEVRGTRRPWLSHQQHQRQQPAVLRCSQIVSTVTLSSTEPAQNTVF